MRIRIGGTVLFIKLPTLGNGSKPWTSLIFLCLVFLTIYYITSSPHRGAEDELVVGRRSWKNSDNDDTADIVNPDEANVHADPGIRGLEGGEDLDVALSKIRRHQKDDPGRRKSPVQYPVKMAMDPARGRQRVLMDIQRAILKNQVRPPDDSYNINITLSDSVSMDRSIPDTRPPICRSFAYDLNKLPRATVIIPFYNEALSMILRTVHSILNRTPDQLLQEVILVDDCSTRDYLKEPLERYLRLLPKVTLVRNAQREGLIRSRMKGYRMSKSPVVIFQDAHTECNSGWLEPLLDELERNPRSVVQPFVDGIDRLTLDFAAPPTYYRGAFSWDLRYVWLRLPDHEHKRCIETGAPFFTPTLVGCAIAVKKDYFDELGGFDEALNVWGGENTELSFRTWMCGGRVVTVTCARVGHVFKEFPYKFDGDKETIVQKNLIRVTEAWMDSVKKYFYAATRVYEFKRAELNPAEQTSLQEHIGRRKQMNCKNFEWFMYNVVPEIDIPPMNAVYYGELMNLESRACFEVTDDYYIGLTYFCFEHKIIPKNNFVITKDGLFRYRDKCVKIDPPAPILMLSECPPLNKGLIEKFGVWEMKSKGHTWGYLRVKRKNKDGVFEKFCVLQVTNILNVHHREQMPQIGSCDDVNRFQMWSWTYKFDWSRVPQVALDHYSGGTQS